MFQAKVKITGYFYMLDVYDIPTTDMEEVEDYILDKFCLKCKRQIEFISDLKKQ